MIGHFMVVFGGLYELTKELNDLFVFDLKTWKWTKIFDENDYPGSPTRLPESSRRDTTLRELGSGQDADTKRPGTTNQSKAHIPESPYVAKEEGQAAANTTVQAFSNKSL